MEQKETELSSKAKAGEKIFFISIALIVIIVGIYGYIYLTTDPTLEKEITLGETYMYAKQAQDSVIHGKQFVYVKILFTQLHDDSVQTENILIPRDNLNLDDSKAIIFKDSICSLGKCHLSYYKDGKKILKHDTSQ